MLADINRGKLSGLKYELVCLFKLAVDIVGSGFREFVNDTDGPAFLGKDLMGFDVDGY